MFRFKLSVPNLNKKEMKLHLRQLKLAGYQLLEKMLINLKKFVKLLKLNMQWL